MTTLARDSALAVLLIAGAATVSVSPIPAAAAPDRAQSSHAYLVQGVPGQAFDIEIDGKAVESDVAAKDVVGPLDLEFGDHDITFTSDDLTVESSFVVDRRSQDIVVHRPADSTDKPEVTVFANDLRPIAAGKGRITVAHTAVVPPADIVVDGKVLFANIANGEFVNAEVPATTYSVEVVLTGQKSDPLLGPVDLPVEAGALTRVFAIGAPQNGSMDAVVQVLPIAKGGSPAPGSIDAGEAGLVAESTAPTSSHGALLPVVVLGGLILLGSGLAGAGRVAPEGERTGRRATGSSAGAARVRRPSPKVVAACGAVAGLAMVAAYAAGWVATGTDDAAPSSPSDRENGRASESVHAPREATGPPDQRPRQGGGSAQVATPAPSQVNAERPRGLTLPSGTKMVVDTASTGAGGRLVIPSDINKAGWWDGSAQLGDPFGSIVLAAHVDSFDQGIGRIAELLDADVGDRLVLATRHLRQRFRVVSAELVPKAALSSSSAIYAIGGDPRLVLVTCGGDYDASSGGYQDNLIVEAVPVGTLTEHQPH